MGGNAAQPVCTISSRRSGARWRRSRKARADPGRARYGPNSPEPPPPEPDERVADPPPALELGEDGAGCEAAAAAEGSNSLAGEVGGAGGGAGADGTPTGAGGGAGAGVDCGGATSGLTTGGLSGLTAGESGLSLGLRIGSAIRGVIAPSSRVGGRGSAR